LTVLELADDLIVWDDQRIDAGDAWLPEIEAALQSAEVAVLLISADFLTSPFIRRSEIPRLLDRRQTEGVRVIPIFVRPCPWSAVGWLAALQGRPKNGKALSELRRHQAEKHLAALALEIREFLGRSLPRRASSPTDKTETKDPAAPPGSSNEADKARREIELRERRSLSGVIGDACAFVWTRTAPTAIVLAVQFILSILILHTRTETIGLSFGFFGPLVLLPISYVVSRIVSRDATLARILGALVGGVVGAAISGGQRWGVMPGLVFGSFFCALLAGYWIEATKQMRVIWAILSTVLIVGCLGGFQDYEFIFRFPYVSIGTSWVIAFWAAMAIVAKLAWWLWLRVVRDLWR
jgi:hypothetical protein